MEFWELDVVDKPSCLDDVWEATKSIVEVLESWSIKKFRNKGILYLLSTTSQSPTFSLRKS